MPQEQKASVKWYPNQNLFLMRLISERVILK